MNYIFACLVPLIFLSSFLFAAFKKVHIYNSFTEGVKGAIPLIISIFPYIATVTMLSKLLQVSGLGDTLARLLAPFFDSMGVPKEISSLILIKPLSGSGAIAVLTEILTEYGVDSFAGKCACVIYGSSETVFYIGAVYFAGIQRKKMPIALGISLFAYLASVLLACFLCKIM